MNTENLKEKMVKLKDERRDLMKEIQGFVTEIRKRVAKRATLSDGIKEAAKQIRELNSANRTEAKKEKAEAKKAAKVSKKAVKPETKVETPAPTAPVAA